jgi:hypothetical protein
MDVLVFFLHTQRVNALFDPGTGTDPRSVLHTIQDMGWELLRRKRAL